MKEFKELIKRNIVAVLLLFFLVGAGFIWAAGWFSFYLSNDEKVNATVLWLTSLAIFWYAYETYQLKISTSDQAAIQEVIMQNEFLPILEPVSGKGSGASWQGGRFHNFEMRNLGRGPAKYMQLHVGAIHVPLEFSLAGGERGMVTLPLAARRELTQFLKTQPAKLQLRIIYQDIYKRKFQTEHIVFDKRARGAGYQLRQGSWDFRRVRS
jgi:hypothetical protein